MSRPANKSELLSLSLTRFKQLNEYVDSFPESEKNREFPAGTMNRNFRDVLAHLHHWHLMMIEWYTTGMQGNKPEMPAKGYTWKTTPDLNASIWEIYRSTDLQTVQKLLDRSFKDVLSLINCHTNEELFEKKKYKWTGSTSLGAYFISCTSSHYDWALKLIKKAMK